MDEFQKELIDTIKELGLQLHTINRHLDNIDSRLYDMKDK